MLGTPEALYIPGENERLLQGLGENGGMASLGLPKRGVPRNRSTLHLKPRGPGALPSACLSFLTTLYRFGPLIVGVLGLLLLLGALLRCHLTFLQIFG